MGRIVRRLTTGMKTVIEWSPDDEASYREAQEVLRHQLHEGYNAVRVRDNHYEPVHELPRDADTIILSTAMGGG